MRINKVFKKLIQYQITKINKVLIKINKMYKKSRNCQQKRKF